MNDDRIGGFIHKVVAGSDNSGFGIIIGDDGRHYMFLPSYLREPLIFPRLTPQTLVTFKQWSTPRGMRARNITVTQLVPRPEAVQVTYGERP